MFVFILSNDYWLLVVTCDCTLADDCLDGQMLIEIIPFSLGYYLNYEPCQSAEY
jgi:hypothetical protein